MEHVFETKIQELKTQVLTEVARLAWEDRLQTGILDVPEKIIPGPTASLRCCIYKERAIINSRVKLAMGGDKTNPSVVEVLPIACDECPVTEITVGDSCRGCLATRVSTPAPRTPSPSSTTGPTSTTTSASPAAGASAPASTAPSSRPSGPARRAAR